MGYHNVELNFHIIHIYGVEFYIAIKHYNSGYLSTFKNACDIIWKNQNIHFLHAVIVTNHLYLLMRKGFIKNYLCFMNYIITVKMKVISPVLLFILSVMSLYSICG